MSYEFECFSCGSFSIFNKLHEVKENKHACLECGKPFSLEKNLMRFDRTENDKLGILIPPEQAIHQRLEQLIEKVSLLVERVSEIQNLLYESSQDDSLDS